MSAVMEAYQRLGFAMQCEERGEEGEAYRHYIATLSFISTSLLQESNKDGAGVKKMLDLAGMCLESSKRIVSKEKIQPATASTNEPTPTPATAHTNEPAPTPANEPAPTPAAAPTSEPPSNPANEPINEPTPTPATAHTNEPTPTPANEPAPTPAPNIQHGGPGVVSRAPSLTTSHSATVPSSSEGLFEESLGDDIFDILSSLPDVPANKPGDKYKAPVKRSQTLPDLPKPPPTDHQPYQPPSKPSPKPSPKQSPRRSFISPPPAPSPQSAHLSTIARAAVTSIPPPPEDLQYFAAPLGTNLGGTLSNPVVFRVSPLERARQQNTQLAAQFARRRSQNPASRLELARRQQENLQIAQGLEATLAKKADQRKQRLEQEAEESVEGSTLVVCTFEGILLAKMDQVWELKRAVKAYDIQNKVWPVGQSIEEKAQTILRWCLNEPHHPLNHALGEAQHNFFYRLNTLDKKMYLGNADERKVLRPGISAELEMISDDVMNYFRNILTILHGCYPLLKELSEEDQCETSAELARTFFSPFLKLLIKMYAASYEEDHRLYQTYLERNSSLSVEHYIDIRDNFKVDYTVAIETLQKLSETHSPEQKMALLVQSSREIPECVYNHHIASGLEEEKARELSCMGADDLLPVTIYLISQANIPDLYPELLMLYSITPEEKLKGKEGYCLTNFQNAVFYLIEEQRSFQASE